MSGLRIGASVDFGYAAVGPAVRAAFSKAVGCSRDCGAQLSADGPVLDPDILEHTLKPIAFTEQAAAVAGRIDDELAPSEREYLEVVAARAGLQRQSTMSRPDIGAAKRATRFWSCSSVSMRW